MLLILAEANAFNTSGAYNEFPKWGRPPAPFGEGRPEAAPIICSASTESHWPPLVLKALATTFLKALANYLF